MRKMSKLGDGKQLHQGGVFLVHSETEGTSCDARGGTIAHASYQKDVKGEAIWKEVNHGKERRGTKESDGQ